jgi:hypothetical protein
MYRVHVLTHVKGGGMPEAIGVAREIAEHVGRKYGASVQTYMQPFGQAGVVHWMADYADLAAVESLQSQTMADQDYWVLVKKLAAFTIDGTTKFILLRAI